MAARHRPWRGRRGRRAPTGRRSAPRHRAAGHERAARHKGRHADRRQNGGTTSEAISREAARVLGKLWRRQTRRGQRAVGSGGSKTLTSRYPSTVRTASTPFGPRLSLRSATSNCLRSAPSAAPGASRRAPDAARGCARREMTCPASTNSVSRSRPSSSASRPELI